MLGCESLCYDVGCNKCEGPGSTYETWLQLKATGK